MTAPRWTRRSVLGLGLAGGALVLGAGPAHAAQITVGDLAFGVPAEISPDPDDASLGAGWQWRGTRTRAGGRPTTVVLARADLMTTDPGEILGLLLAGSTAALLPGLAVADVRSRTMTGGGNQTLVNLSYLAQQSLRYHGTLLIATRPRPPAGLLVVVGDDSLSAGGISAVLGSAQWLG